MGSSAAATTAISIVVSLLAIGYLCLCIILCTHRFCLSSEASRLDRANSTRQDKREEIINSNLITKIATTCPDNTNSCAVEDVEDPPKTCPICFDDFVQNDSVSFGFCRHVFHTECLMKWLEKHNSCCYCREIIVTFDDAHQRLNSDDFQFCAIHGLIELESDVRT